MASYYDTALETKDKLAQISPTMCMAKWLQVSIHLTMGHTHSCYHPPVHKISVDEIKKRPSALHNTAIKFNERKQMLNGERPIGCQYCWNIEDAPGGPHISDRHYRSGEWWIGDGWNEVVNNNFDYDINPRYVEVNFNQTCNFKCIYCSPHLSSEWEKEIKEHGSIILFKEETHNNIHTLRENGWMPLEVPNAENPYVEAFWKWWPELYKTLKVFRMTGGEPLVDKNTFKILEYVNENPNSGLDLSITSNMCPPENKLFEKFLSSLKKIEEVRVWEDKEKINPDTGNNWYVAPACKHFSIFVSLDSVGAQAEYIRHGLNYDTLLNNVRRVIRETHGTEISFINTFNLLSIPKLKEFLKMILDLRIEFGYEKQAEHVIQPPDYEGFKHQPFVRAKRQRIWFDIPYLRKPTWLSIQNAAFYPDLMNYLYEALAFMEENREKENYGRTYHGFKDYEIAKLKRNIAWAEEGKNTLTDEELKGRQARFWKFHAQIDDRRGLNFLETFPEFLGWWEECREVYDKLNRN